MWHCISRFYKPWSYLLSWWCLINHEGFLPLVAQCGVSSSVHTNYLHLNEQCLFPRKYQRGMRNAFGSHPQWRENPYLHLLAGERGQRWRGLNNSRDTDSPSTKCQRSEGVWAGRGQGNFLFLGWETILEGGWTTSWPTAWRCGRKQEYYHIIIFPKRTWNFTLKKRRTSEHHSEGTFQ